MATRKGLENNDYNPYSQHLPDKPAGSHQGVANAAVWDQVMDQVMESLGDALRVLQSEGFSPPDEVGYELEDTGQVVAEAELAWTNKRLVVLMPHQQDYQEVWLKHQWKVILVEADWLTALREQING
ncbi:MAG: hypothetical protein HQM12_23520 [SAR324 cluster bacterium]|nr:hypothetical protein [SAR324 cluster bacterium]